MTNRNTTSRNSTASDSTSRDSTSRDFENVLEYIEDELAFEPASYNDAYLDRRITSRMRRTGSDDHREYLRLLRKRPEEQAALLDALSINVTEFFRNPEVWEALRPLLRSLTRDNRRVHCWSAACSDGREPYSLALLARDDSEIDADRLRIVATDIDAGILDVAREGVYETTATTDIETELEPLDDHEEFVRKEDNRFEVAPSVRDMVTFEQHDLIGDRPKTDVDLLLCRNLLIYIDAEYKEPIFETLVNSLRDGGYLVLGMSETPPTAYRDVLDPVEKSARIYRKDS